MKVQKQVRSIPGKRLYRILSMFPEDDLRRLARHHDIPCGKNKEVLLCNLVRQRSRFSRTMEIRIF